MSPIFLGSVADKDESVINTCRDVGDTRVGGIYRGVAEKTGNLSDTSRKEVRATCLELSLESPGVSLIPPEGVGSIDDIPGSVDPNSNPNFGTFEYFHVLALCGMRVPDSGNTLVQGVGATCLNIKTMATYCQHFVVRVSATLV